MKSIALSVSEILTALSHLIWACSRCHGNKGRSELNSNDTIIVQDLKNPVWSQIFGSISYRSRFIANFALKFAVFVSMATGFCLSKL